ncbi:MAG: Type 1 glutamine amidotransferase-like domain-containing protein [Candidatus Parcubacteria bacterium]|nr:Type 1 glutamine amidotransferase-like domain-containing protein [Candidatus Parcubacteria bacterium]
MIKAIIIGGGDLDETILNKIKDESTLDFSKSKVIRTMVIPYARYEEDWDTVYKKNTVKYTHADYKYDFIYPSRNPEEFYQQLCHADLVIVPGGSELGLKNNLPKVSSSHFENKTIIATSAGTNFLAKSYYSNDRNEIADGIGILKINTICHFKINNIDKVKNLVELNNLPTLALKEGDFSVIYGN